MDIGLIVATKEILNYDYNSMPAAGIGYLAGIIKQKLPTVTVLLGQDIDVLIKKKPDIIGISSVTENYHIAVEWASKIKEHLDIPVLIGGIHITLLPESINSNFDIAIMGEGEYTIVELLQSFIDNNNSLNFTELAEIRGLYYLRNGKPVLTGTRELISDLDALPTIPYDSLPFYNESACGCIVASRGCPFKCSFCASEKMFQKYRSFSVERIMKDVRYFIELGKQHIVFYDDLLIADKHRLEGLVIAIEKEKINKKCSFSCQVRANRITPDICKLLNRMGVTDAGIGTESFSDKILTYYNKTSVTAEVNQKAIDMLYEYNIKLNPSIIFGAPIETKEDMLITFREVFKNVRDGKINSPMWGLLRPYPGTMIWEDAARRGIVGPTMDFSKFSNWSTFDLYLCEHVTKDEFRDMMREWSTKITLLYQKKGVLTPESNFAFSNRITLGNNIAWLSNLINMPQREPELGDDLIIEANKQDFITYHNGWFPPEENHRWMSKESDATLTSSGMGLILLNGYIPYDILDKVYNGRLELSFYVNSKKNKTFEVTRECCDNGLFMVEIPVEKKSSIHLRIVSDKSFIPKEHGLSEDCRCFSIIIGKIEAL